LWDGDSQKKSEQKGRSIATGQGHGGAAGVKVKKFSNPTPPPRSTLKGVQGVGEGEVVKRLQFWLEIDDFGGAKNRRSPSTDG